MLNTLNQTTMTADQALGTGLTAEIVLAKLLADACAELDILQKITERAGFEIVFRAPGGILIGRPGHPRADGSPSPIRGGLPPSVLRRVREHVESNLKDSIELADLAAVANLSRCHFAKAFKQSVGCTPHRYVMSRRLEMARRCLRETVLPVAEIAQAAGFADQSHLSRCFRAYFGTSPLMYRRNRL